MPKLIHNNNSSVKIVVLIENYDGFTKKYCYEGKKVEI